MSRTSPNNFNRRDIKNKRCNWYHSLPNFADNKRKDLPYPLRNGRFYLRDEYERRRKKILKKKLP